MLQQRVDVTSVAAFYCNFTAASADDRISKVTTKTKTVQNTVCGAAPRGCSIDVSRVCVCVCIG